MFLPNDTPLPPYDHDDPFQTFIQHDLDLDGLMDEDDLEDEQPLRMPRRFGSSFAHPPITLPPLSDPHWRRGRLTLSEPLTVHRYPRVFSDVLCYLPATGPQTRDSILYLPEVQPGWTAIHLAVGPGFVRSSDFPITPRRRWHWPRFRWFWLVIVLAVLVVALGLEQERTWNSLNATITAQQAQIADLQAILIAVDSGP